MNIHGPFQMFTWFFLSHPIETIDFKNNRFEDFFLAHVVRLFNLVWMLFVALCFTASNAPQLQP